MADHDEGAGEPVQPILQPFDSAEIEMVGRLVEHEDVRLLSDRADDCSTAAFTPTGRMHRPRKVEPDLVRDRGRLVRFRRIGPVQNPVEKGRMVSHVRILLQQHDAASRDDRSPPLVRIDQAREALQKRRLSDAVATDQS